MDSCCHYKTVSIGDGVLSLDFGCIDHLCRYIPNFGYREIRKDSVDEVFGLIQASFSCKDIEGLSNIDIVHQKLGFL